MAYLFYFLALLVGICGTGTSPEITTPWASDHESNGRLQLFISLVRDGYHFFPFLTIYTIVYQPVSPTT
jgi:hypothetical protein